MPGDEHSSRPLQRVDDNLLVAAVSFAIAVATIAISTISYVMGVGHLGHHFSLAVASIFASGLGSLALWQHRTGVSSGGE